MPTQVNGAKSLCRAVVGLTGGIACGKTLAANYLQSKGAFTLDADEIARDLLLPGSPTLEKLRTCLRENSRRDPFHANGSLDRVLLNEMIFSDASLRREVESVLHPPILQTLLGGVSTLKKNQPDAVVLLVAPLLFETNLQRYCRKSLVVACREKNQIERLVQRNQFSEDQALARIHAQMPTEEKVKLADWVIWNDASPEDLYRHLDILWPQIQETCRS